MGTLEWIGILTVIANFAVVFIAAYQIIFIKKQLKIELELSKSSDINYCIFNIGGVAAFKITVSGKKDFKNAKTAFRPINPGEYSFIDFVKKPEKIYIKCNSKYYKDHLFEWNVKDLVNHAYIGVRSNFPEYRNETIVIRNP